MPYALALANKGLKRAMHDDPALMKGLNTYQGKVTNKAVAEAQGLAYEPVSF